MRNVSATQCDCLPDCESTTFQYSVSSNNFMWAAFFLCPNYDWSKLVQGMWLSQPQHQPTLLFGGRASPKTLAWGGDQLGIYWTIPFPCFIATHRFWHKLLDPPVQWALEMFSGDEKVRGVLRFYPLVHLKHIQSNEEKTSGPTNWDTGNCCRWLVPLSLFITFN